MTWLSSANHRERTFCPVWIVEIFYCYFAPAVSMEELLRVYSRVPTLRSGDVGSGFVVLVWLVALLRRHGRHISTFFWEDVGPSSIMQALDRLTN